MLRKLTREVVFKVLLQVLIVFMSATIGVGPLYSQSYSDYRNLKNRISGQQESSGASFRQKGQQGKPQDGLQSLTDQMGRNAGGMMQPGGAMGVLYQVHVLGEVENPGTYRVMASERLAEVLENAGDVSKHGSQRRIEIRRNGKTIKTVDLLKYKLYGQLEHNPYLLDNDVVFVPLKNVSIQIVGAVKRPDTYELMGEKTVQQVIKLAGGLSSSVARGTPVRVIRFVNGEKKVFEINPSKSALNKFGVKAGDVIFVPDVLTAGHQFDYNVAEIPGGETFYPSYEDRVFVLGGVNSPGPYPFNPYHNLLQYITIAGGFSPLSTKKITIVAHDGKKKKIKRKNMDSATINPGDAIYVGHRRIAPETWLGLFMGVTGFGLSTTATVLALTK